jgi:hypothetical protein
MKHLVEHLWFPKAAVETIAEFRQIARQTFGADTMVDTPNIAFDISDQGVDPGQDLRRFLSRTGDQPFVTESGRSIQEAITLPTLVQRGSGLVEHGAGGQGGLITAGLTIV